MMFNVFDCGARGGKHRSWKSVDLEYDYYMFEPEGEEFKKLEIHGDGANKIINAAVSDKEGQQKLNIYSDESLSSLLEIDKSQAYRFRNITLVEQIDVNVTTISNICDTFNIVPHFMSIDVQGLSFEVLKGTGKYLCQSLAIRVEAEFFPFYKQEKTIFELGSWLNCEGFELVRLETCGPGHFGVSSDMNHYSVDSDDAKPMWSDCIFLNVRYIEELIKKRSKPDFVLAALVFMVHNHCGYQALKYLFLLEVSYLSDASKSILSSSLPLFYYYLNLPRIDYNKHQNYNSELFHLESMMKDMKVENKLSETTLEKINSIYLTTS